MDQAVRLSKICEGTASCCNHETKHTESRGEIQDVGQRMASPPLYPLLHEEGKACIWVATTPPRLPSFPKEGIKGWLSNNTCDASIHKVIVAC